MLKSTSLLMKALAMLLLTSGLFAAGSVYAEKTCLSCHGKKDAGQTILHRAHGQAADERLPDGAAMCQSCHGASADHTAKPKKNSPDIRFAGEGASSAEEQSAVCTGCHDGGHQKAWPVSEHAAADVACTDCHNIHALEDLVQNPRTQSGVCLDCHVEQKANAAKFSRHPVKEGIVACSDCHNTHGGKGPSMLKEFTVNETCYECHTEKRGPFLWEHEPVQDDCTNCHTPHGSIHDNMLIARQPQLCQQCHDDTSHRGYNYAQEEIPNRRGPPSPIRESHYATGKSCLNCHGEIHGSNHVSGGGYFE